jgi:hypothetical protein
MRLRPLPPISSEQVALVRRQIQETGAEEANLLRILKAQSVEEIKDFERAMTLLEPGQRGKENPPAKGRALIAQTNDSFRVPMKPFPRGHEVCLKRIAITNRPAP